MSDRADWQPLRDELRRWTAAGRKAKFWFRDDDDTAKVEIAPNVVVTLDRRAIAAVATEIEAESEPETPAEPS